MPSSSGQLKLGLSPACKSHELYPEHISEAEALLVQKPCKDTHINCITCATKDRAEFVAEANGLSLLTVSAQPTLDPEQLARFIPIAHGKVFGLDPATLPFTQVGVSLKDAFKGLPGIRSGYLHWYNLRMREDLLKQPIFTGKQPILFLSGRDLLIESIDQDEQEIGFYKKLSKMGFHMVSAFNFSQFFGECALDQNLNTKRSLESFRSLQEHGIMAVPHFYWANEFLSQKTLEWLLRETSVKLISINCQCFKKMDYPIVEAGLRLLAEKTNGRIHFLLEGPQRKLLMRLKDLSHLIHVAVKSPTMDAINHTKVDTIGGKLIKTLKSPKSISFLLSHNTRAYENYLNESFWDDFSSKTKRDITKPIITRTMIYGASEKITHKGTGRIVTRWKSTGTGSRY